MAGVNIAIGIVLLVFLSLVLVTIRYLSVSLPDNTDGLGLARRLRWQQVDEVQSPLSIAQQVEIIEDLNSKSADPRAVYNVADRVTMIAVRFERFRYARLDKAPETLDLPYSVEFDLTRADRSAAVTLADQSVDWRVTPPKIATGRASFALESSTLPSPDNIPEGALAAFRIASVSHAPVAVPLDPWNTEREKAATLCRSLERWAQFFGIQRSGLSYLYIEDPTRIWFDGRGWSSDGVTVASLDKDEVAAMCREARVW